MHGVTATDTGTWAAPYASGPVRGAVDVPGSKSITNRALLLAALADAPSSLHRPLLARDTRLMMRGLMSLGVAIAAGADSLTVTPAALAGPADVDCGLAGTVMRFVPPVAALATGTVSFDGDPRARERPMDQILDALRALGVAVQSAARSLPFSLRAPGEWPGAP